MNTHAPRGTPADMAGEAAVAQHEEAKLPAKRSKLTVAMEKVTSHMTEIQGLDATIAEVEGKYPKDHRFPVATKEGYRLADTVRKQARESRLHVKKMRDEGTTLLNGLKTELWAVADPQMARLQGIEDNAKEQIAAQDAIEAARKRKHEDALIAIGSLATGAATLSSEELAVRITKFLNVKTDGMEEYEERAKIKCLEVGAILQEAHEKALAREAAEKAQREAEAKQSAARLRIANYKALPESVPTDQPDAIVMAMGTIQQKDDDEAKYADLAEFVEMAREKALRTLRDMHVDAVAAVEEKARQTRVAMTAPDLSAEIPTGPMVWTGPGREEDIPPPTPINRRRPAGRPVPQVIAPPPQVITPDTTRFTTPGLAEEVENLPPAGPAAQALLTSKSPWTEKTQEFSLLTGDDPVSTLTIAAVAVQRFFASYPENNGAVPADLWQAMSDLRISVDYDLQD